MDKGAWASEFAEMAFVRLAGRQLYVLHDLNTLQIDPAAEGIDVIVSGHFHAPKIDTLDGLLYVNLGSAGALALQATGYARESCSDDRRT